jgi:acyl-CoA synthetase (NDP forming)
MSIMEETDRQATLRRTLDPGSVVLIGASRDTTRVGGGMAAAFARWGFKGDLGFVGRANPDGTDDPKGPWFTSVGDAAAAMGAFDLAVLSIGTDHVLRTLEDCAAAGVSGVIVLANAGGGDDLASLSGAVTEFSQRTGVRVIGPSSAGLLDPTRGLPASLMRRVTTEEPLTGPGVAILSNSGAFANEMLWGLRRQNVGISFWLTVGAEADVPMGDVMSALSDRTDISAVITLTESMGNGAAYLRGARELTEAGIPVLAYQLLTSEEARSVASLHAGTASAPGELWRAAAAAAGVVSCESMEMLGWSAVWVDFSRRHSDATARQRTGVVTISGGGGVVAVDRGAQRGVEFAETLGPKTLARLEELGIPTTNPVDIGATTSRPALELLGEVTDLLAADANVDAVWLQATSALYDNEARAELMQILAANPRERREPVLVSTVVGWPDDYVPSAGGLVVSVPSIDTALWALAAQGGVARQLERAARHARSPAVEPNAGLSAVSSLTDGLRLAESWEAFRVPSWWALDAANLEAKLAEIAEAATYPLVAKPDSMGHKSRAGQVRLGIGSIEELATVVRELGVGDGATILVQEQVQGVEGEVLMGCLSAPDIGEVAIIGVGGVDTDDNPKRVILSLPTTSAAVADAVAEFVELSGSDTYSSQLEAAFTELIARFCGREAEIAGVELNPVMTTPEGCWVVDVRIAV